MCLDHIIAHENRFPRYITRPKTSKNTIEKQKQNRICSRLVIVDQDGQKNHNREMIGVFIA